jgi:hypothetical protein
MKANITLEISKEDLAYELQNLVSEIASDEVRSMVKKTAQELVKQEIKKIIAPVVDDYLKSALVGSDEYNRNSISRRDIDSYIKRVISDYMDEPCYLYSKSSQKLSEKYCRSNGDRTTRSELWVIEKAREYAKTELFDYINNSVETKLKAIMPSKEEIDAIIKSKIVEQVKAGEPHD